MTNVASQLTELIVQQRHHPSIVCWGVQNRDPISESSADPRPVIAELHALARELDPSRRTAQAQVFMAGPEDPINAVRPERPQPVCRLVLRPGRAGG